MDKHEKIAGQMSQAQVRILVEALQAGNVMPRTVTTSTLDVFQRHGLIVYPKPGAKGAWCRLTAEGVRVAKFLALREHAKDHPAALCGMRP